MKRLPVAVLVGIVLLLAGCSTIPSSGTVQAGTTEAPNGTSIVYVPNPPASGANQREIVAGFLTAASGGGRFAVAKEYLTDDFATRWNPTSRVLVQAPQTSVTTGSGADIRVEVPISARVNVHGVYSPSSDPETLTFHLVQQRGQWRIDRAPDGILLSQTVFQKNYAPSALQFFDPTWTHLVPDLRWFPTTLTSGSSAPSPRSILTALISGPVGPIAAGVTSNALKGTSIAGIDSTGDVTTVVLNDAGATPTATETARMQQQMIQSLGLPTPSALRLVIDGVVAPQVKALADQPSSEAFVLVDGRFGTLSSAGSFTQDKTLGTQIAATRPTAITVSLGQKLAAVREQGGAVAVVGPSGAKVVDTRGGLVPPTIDQQAWVYSVPTGVTDGLQAANAKGQTFALSGDLGGESVTAIQVSPDGTRMLVLVGSPAGPSAFVAGIVRDSSGKPIGLSGQKYPVSLGGTSGTGLDATWVDDDRVAVLVSSSDNSIDRVVSQQLGGLGTSLGQFANVTSIVGTTGFDDLRIRVQSGGIYVWQDPNWQQETADAVDVSVLAVQR